MTSTMKKRINNLLLDSNYIIRSVSTHKARPRSIGRIYKNKNANATSNDIHNFKKYVVKYAHILFNHNFMFCCVV